MACGKSHKSKCGSGTKKTAKKKATAKKKK